MTIQFAEGRWTGRREGEIGEGLALTDEAFDVVEPCVRAACPEWTPSHRYGVFELSEGAPPVLATLLRAEAERFQRTVDAERKAELLRRLAEWLEARSDHAPISILGY